MHRVAIVDNNYESLPIFPLPNFVMFPHLVTRLHVFEPRYRLMVAEALAGQRLIVLVGLKDGWEEDYYDSPPVHEIGSLCKIINDDRLRDGRYNLQLHCLARVRICTIHGLKPFRTGQVEVLPDDFGSDEPRIEAVTRLTSVVRGLILHLGEHATVLADVIGRTRKHDILTNRLAHVLATEPAIRQALLEVTDIAERAEWLTDIAGDLLLRATSIAGPESTSDSLLIN